MNNRNSAFCMQLHTNFVVLWMRYYQQRGNEIFSDNLGLIQDSDKLRKLKKKSSTNCVILFVKNWH